MRAKVNLSIDAAVTREARALGVNMSRVAEAAIAEAARHGAQPALREENREALERLAREVERDGPALARFRSWSERLGGAASTSGGSSENGMLVVDLQTEP